MNLHIVPFLVLITLPVTSIAGLFGDDKTPDQHRAEIGQMRDKTLTRLYKEQSDTKAEIAKAVGYAVFDDTGVHVLVVSGGFGHGIAHDNKSGKETYMKMYTAGAGPGIGVKDYRVIFVFHTREKFDQFLSEGWGAEGQADAAATTGKRAQKEAVLSRSLMA
jgi:lipid-binding SYLF domain-containing protein